MITLIGPQLRTRREQMNLTLKDLSHQTRIPAATLRALEEDDYAHLGGLVYACGFLRSYSRCLGIDAAPSIERLRSAAPATPAARVHGGEIPYGVWHDGMPERHTSSSMPPLVALSFLLILFVGISGFWISEPDSKTLAAARQTPPAPAIRIAKQQPTHALSYTQVSKPYAVAQEGQ